MAAIARELAARQAALMGTCSKPLHIPDRRSPNERTDARPESGLTSRSALLLRLL